MFIGAADTHTALWYLFGDLRLSRDAKTLIDDAVATRRKIALPSICVAEIVYLVEKRRISLTAFDDIVRAATHPDHVFEEVPLTIRIVSSMRQISREEVPDMPDRIVAATAEFLRVPVISRDGRIRSSNVTTVW